MIVTRLFESMWSTLGQLAPWLLFGAFIAGLLHVLLPADFVRRQLRGGRGVLKAVLVGVPLPLCSCGVIPAGLGLKKDGASDGAALGFLISTPQTGVDSVLVSASFLGWPFALFKVAAAAVTGLVGGWAVGRGAAEPAAEERGAPELRRRSVRALVSHAVELLQSIWRWLVFGIVVSAAIDVLVPPELMAGWADLGSLGASLAVLVISLPLYVCATASVPIAAALVAGGMPTGAALVFLMAGPASNVATIGAIFRAFGRRVLAIYLGVIVVGSVGGGWIFDRWFEPLKTVAVEHQHEASGWEAVGAVLLLALMVKFLGDDLLAFWRRRRSVAPAGTKHELDVAGMTCGGCTSRLETALDRLPGVTAVEVTLEPSRATVYGEVDDSRLRETIRESGFQPL